MAFVDLMTPEDMYEAEATFREFLVNKPNPPEHADYVARAAQLYPDLPPGAQQNALHCLETVGKGHAKRYASNARARQAQNSRGMRRAAEPPPYVFQGVRRDSPKRAREEAERCARYAEYMAMGRIKYERRVARERKAAERKLAKALAVVEKPAEPPKVVHEPRDHGLVPALVKLFRSKIGATYAEAAKKLGIEPKGDKPHQSPAAQVRALVRDKVRQLHEIVAAGHDRERGGVVYRLTVD